MNTSDSDSTLVRVETHHIEKLKTLRIAFFVGFDEYRLCNSYVEKMVDGNGSSVRTQFSLPNGSCIRPMRDGDGFKTHHITIDKARKTWIRLVDEMGFNELSPI